jgi:tetratricopeptide (TPR) repeat protein
MGHYRQSTGHHQQALAVFREIGDQRGQARALHNLGTVELLQARPQQASGYFRQALPRYRQAGDQTGEARTLNNLGTVDGLQRRYQQAAEHHQQALDLFDKIGDRSGEAEALNGLGRAHSGLARAYSASGNPGQARRHWLEALARYTECGAPEADQVRAELATPDGQGYLTP